MQDFYRPTGSGSSVRSNASSSRRQTERGPLKTSFTDPRSRLDFWDGRGHHVDVCGARCARGNNAGSGGYPDGGRREETQTDSAQVGRWTWSPSKETEAGARDDAISRPGSKKKPADICKSTTLLKGIIIKQCRRTEQETRSLCGVIFDTIIMATEHDVVKSMREQTRRYNEGVQAAGKGHTLCPLQIGMTDHRSPEAGSSGWSGQRNDTDRLLGTARRHEHGHEVRSCEVLQGRSNVPIRASSRHSGGQQVRRTRPSRERAATVGSSTQVRQSTTDSTVSRTPVAGHSTRQEGIDLAC